MEKLDVLSRSPLLPQNAGDTHLTPRTAAFQAVLMTALREGAALAPGVARRVEELPQFNRGRRVTAATPSGFSRL
jgi:hypothetical protein